MGPRLPTKADFPENVKLAIVEPPAKDPPTNVLLLFHGLGDSYEAFANLGQQMRLPETVCVAVQGPQPLLDLGGFHWGDDIIFNSSDAGLDADAGFAQATALLKLLVQDVVIQKCGYRARDVLCFGFGQGGMTALNLAVALGDTADSELGGVVSIGAGLPSLAPASLDVKNKTPILVCAGSDQSSVTSSSEEKLKHVFESVEIKRYRRRGDNMPNSRDEMMPIMQFFSRRLRSIKGAPEGSVELGR